MGTSSATNFTPSSWESFDTILEYRKEAIQTDIKETTERDAIAHFFGYQNESVDVNRMARTDLDSAFIGTPQIMQKHPKTIEIIGKIYIMAGTPKISQYRKPKLEAGDYTFEITQTYGDPSPSGATITLPVQTVNIKVQEIEFASIPIKCLSNTLLRVKREF